MLEKYEDKILILLTCASIGSYFISLYAYWTSRTFDALLYAIYAVLFAVVMNGIKD